MTAPTYLSLNYRNTSITNWLKSAYNVKINENEDLSDIFAQLSYNSGFNPYDAIDSYILGLEKSPTGDLINDNKKAGGEYYNLQDNEYYLYTANYLNGNFTSSLGYSNLEIDSSTGYIQPNDNNTATNLTDTVKSQMATLGINSMSPDQLVELYRQLTTELEGLQEYTLSNQSIADIQKQITSLQTSTMVNLETQMKKVQDDLIGSFKLQVAKILSLGDKATDTRNAIFKEGSEGLGIVANMSDEELAKALFGGTSGSYDYDNNLFYNYYVDLRTNSKLTFDNAFNDVLPSWTKNKATISGDSGNFVVGDYEGIAKDDPQLGPVDILQDMYGTQQLLALYKQYEAADNQAHSLELSLSVALQNSAEFDFRKELANQILELLVNNNPSYVEQIMDQMSVAKTIERGSSITAGANSSVTVPKFDGYYGDVNTVAETKGSSTNVLVDPYTVMINGTKYVFGLDSNTNGNLDDVSEILGITDTKENPFKSLLDIDGNADGIISQDELKRAGVVLQAVDASGKLTSSKLDVSAIKSISVDSFVTSEAERMIGTFQVKLANGTVTSGEQTLDDQSYFNNLFGTLVDLRPYQTAAAAASSTTGTTGTTSSTSSTATTASTDTTSTTSSTAASTIVRQTLLDQLNKAYSSIVIDDTSNVEKILDNYCWKKGYSITPAQRIKIVDGIEPMLSVSQIEAKIAQQMQTLNLSA